MNTDTPRTDDEESRIQCDLSSMKLDGWNAAYHEMKEHAQELERELAAAREKLAKAGVGDYKADYFLGELTETGKLRSELKAVTEQRDRLAEALRKFVGDALFYSHANTATDVSAPQQLDDSGDALTMP